MIGAAYLAPEGLTQTLAEDLTRRGVTISDWHDMLALSPEPPVPALWAQTIWTAAQELHIASIGDAARAMRAIQRNWGAYVPEFHGRANLITAKLPPLKARLLKRCVAAPSSHLGAWTLLAPDRLLISATQTSPFINGEVHFEEDRTGPPSRAYLKLWEAWAMIGAWPGPGETCLDLGASPGGWTFAIAQTGASVVAVDKAALDPRVAELPEVTVRRDSAFAMDPANEAPVDWLFSDVIAYPERLLALVQGWIASGKAARILCTIKFQGATDHDAAEAFAAIPGARVMHLFHNKHELTFFWQRGAAGQE